MSATRDIKLDKYEISFFDWSHKTKWLKGEMKRISSRSPKTKHAPQPEVKRPEQLMLFDWEAPRKTRTPHIPNELLVQAGFKPHRRAM